MNLEAVNQQTCFLSGTSRDRATRFSPYQAGKRHYQTRGSGKESAIISSFLAEATDNIAVSQCARLKRA